MPRFAWIWWLDVFFLASLIMAKFGLVVEPDKPTLLDLLAPDDDRDLMWRLFILVDLMITEFSLARKELVPPPWLFREGELKLQSYEVGVKRRPSGLIV